VCEWVAGEEALVPGGMPKGSPLARLVGDGQASLGLARIDASTSATSAGGSPSSPGPAGEDTSAENVLAAAFGLSVGELNQPTGRSGVDGTKRTFHPSSSFNGSRTGYVFKRGMHGVGYYIDDNKHAAAFPPKPLAASFFFEPAASFAGGKQGFVFKRGESGLGYYRDVGLQQQLAVARSSTKQTAAGNKKLGGFRFGGDNRERAFRAFCEQSVANGLLQPSQIASIESRLDLLASGQREAEMMRFVEGGLRGREVTVVGATGRTPRGWWGDGSIGRVLDDGVFDENRPELLPVRIAVRSTALGSSLGDAGIPEVLDVGIRATNLRLRSNAVDVSDGTAGNRIAGTSGTGTKSAGATEGGGFGAVLLCMYAPLVEARSATDAQLEAVLVELRHAGRADANCLVVQCGGAFEWIERARPHVLAVRLSVEHLWCGAGKMRLIERCCGLDILQCMKPLSAWPGQGPPSDYVTNLGDCTRAGLSNPQLQRWEAEARVNPEFARLGQLRAALDRRGVRLLHRFDSLFMRLYAPRAAIPSHRDEGGRRLRIVGNAGLDRRVDLQLKAVGDARCVAVPEAEHVSWLVEHGWAYALTDIGSGRDALESVEAASGFSSAVARQSPGNVDLVVAHEVQPTSPLAPLTMAWVVDLDHTSCGGNAPSIVQRYEEAVLEVMVRNGMSLDKAMEPPRLPSPFLYRPFEAGGGENRQGARQIDEYEPPQSHGIDDATTFIMRVGCGTCAARHWLPAREGPTRKLQIHYTPELHARGCCHSAGVIHVFPILRKVREGYWLEAKGGDAQYVGVALTLSVGGSANVAAALRLRRCPIMEVSEYQAIED
jgi:hypothetical protein